MRVLSEEEFHALRAIYQVGDKVRLMKMDDPYTTLKPGDEGTIRYVDEFGHIGMKWDNGSSLSLIVGEDEFEKL